MHAACDPQKAWQSAFCVQTRQFRPLNAGPSSQLGAPLVVVLQTPFMLPVLVLQLIFDPPQATER